MNAYTDQDWLRRCMENDPASIPGKRAAKIAERELALRPPVATPKIGRRKMSYGHSVCLTALSSGPKTVKQAFDPRGLVSEESTHTRMIRLTTVSPALATRALIPSATHEGVMVWLYTITDAGRAALDVWEAAQ